jgi:nucleobase transporter 1/2
MRELQGAIIVASTFQAFLGYSGLMSILLRYVGLMVALNLYLSFSTFI